jgi:hypothetical protein
MFCALLVPKLTLNRQCRGDVRYCQLFCLSAATRPLPYASHSLDRYPEHRSSKTVGFLPSRFDRIAKKWALKYSFLVINSHSLNEYNMWREAKTHAVSPHQNIHSEPATVTDIDQRIKSHKRGVKAAGAGENRTRL